MQICGVTTAVDISAINPYQEPEYLLPANSHFKVERLLKSANDMAKFILGSDLPDGMVFDVVTLKFEPPTQDEHILAPMRQSAAAEKQNCLPCTVLAVLVVMCALLVVGAYIVGKFGVQP